jgi:hypothetical protein
MRGLKTPRLKSALRLEGISAINFGKEEEMNLQSDNKKSSQDDLAKTTSRGDVELTEEDLGKASGGRADLSDISITKVVDKTSPL